MVVCLQVCVCVCSWILRIAGWKYVEIIHVQIRLINLSHHSYWP